MARRGKHQDDERLLKAGFAPYARPDVPVPITISARVTRGARDIGKLSIKFENAIMRAQKGMQIQLAPYAILICPIVMAPEFVPFAEFATHRRDGEVAVGVRIAYPEWVASSQGEKLKLLSDNVKESLRRIRETHLATHDRDKLIGLVDRALDEVSKSLLSEQQ